LSCNFCQGDGIYCPANSAKPQMCTKGYYCPLRDGSVIYECPKGFFCPMNSNKPIECPQDAECPARSSKPKPSITTLVILGLVLVLAFLYGGWQRLRHRTQEKRAHFQSKIDQSVDTRHNTVEKAMFSQYVKSIRLSTYAETWDETSVEQQRLASMVSMRMVVERAGGGHGAGRKQDEGDDDDDDDTDDGQGFRRTPFLAALRRRISVHKVRPSTPLSLYPSTPQPLYPSTPQPLNPSTP
jgi:hypothetical protein